MKEKLSKEAYIKSLTDESMPVLKKETKIDNEKKRKLCIIGTAGSRNKAPYDDPNCEFWGVAHCLLLGDIKKLDKVFEIHTSYIYDQEISPYSRKPIIHHANKENRLYGGEGNVVAILPEADKNINNYEIFPRQMLKEKYGALLPPSDAFYMTNSIAWMILLGIEKGFDEIHLYGIHLECDSEWAYERPCCEFWLGVFSGLMLAQGKKGVVYIPEESDVLRGYHEYGFADIEKRRKKLIGRLEYFEKVIRDMQQQRFHVITQINQLSKEAQMPLEDKKRQLKNQAEVFSKELEIIEKDKDYELNSKKRINDRLNALRQDLANVDARMNSFTGAKDQVNYFIKELNA